MNKQLTGPVGDAILGSALMLGFLLVVVVTIVEKPTMAPRDTEPKYRTDQAYCEHLWEENKVTASAAFSPCARSRSFLSPVTAGRPNDTCGITNTAKRYGKRTTFLPRCMAVSRNGWLTAGSEVTTVGLPSWPHSS
jgi:hypothetical protein